MESNSKKRLFCSQAAALKMSLKRMNMRSDQQPPAESSDLGRSYTTPNQSPRQMSHTSVTVMISRKTRFLLRSPFLNVRSIGTQCLTRQMTKINRQRNQKLKKFNCNSRCGDIGSLPSGGRFRASRSNQIPFALTSTSNSWKEW